MALGACSPEQIAACPLTEHWSDTHHTQWPARNYRNKIEQAFRDLPEHKVQLCRNEHNELHNTTEPPEKPDRVKMLALLAFHEIDLAI